MPITIFRTGIFKALSAEAEFSGSAAATGSTPIAVTTGTITIGIPFVSGSGVLNTMPASGALTVTYRVEVVPPTPTNNLRASIAVGWLAPAFVTQTGTNEAFYLNSASLTGTLSLSAELELCYVGESGAARTWFWMYRPDAASPPTVTVSFGGASVTLVADLSAAAVDDNFYQINPGFAIAGGSTAYLSSAFSGSAGGSIAASMSIGSDSWDYETPYSGARTWSLGASASASGGSGLSWSASAGSCPSGSCDGQTFGGAATQSLPERRIIVPGLVGYGDGPATSPFTVRQTFSSPLDGTGAATTTVGSYTDGFVHSILQDGHSWTPTLSTTYGTVTSETGTVVAASSGTGYRRVSMDALDTGDGGAVVSGVFRARGWEAYSLTLDASRTWDTSRTTYLFQFGQPVGFDMRAYAYMRVRIRHTGGGGPKTVRIVIADLNAAGIGGNSIIRDFDSDAYIYHRDREGNLLVTGASGEWVEREIDLLNPVAVYRAGDLLDRPIEVDSKYTTLQRGGIADFANLTAGPDAGPKYLTVRPGDGTAEGSTVGSDVRALEIDRVIGYREAIRTWAVEDITSDNRTGYMVLVDGKANSNPKTGNPWTGTTAGLLGGWTSTALQVPSTAWNPPTTTAPVPGDVFTLYPDMPSAGVSGKGVKFGGNALTIIGETWHIDWGRDITGGWIVREQETILYANNWPAGCPDLYDHRGSSGVDLLTLPISFRVRGIALGVIFGPVKRRRGSALSLTRVAGSVGAGSGVSGSDGVFSTGSPFAQRLVSGVSHTATVDTNTDTFPFFRWFHRITASDLSVAPTIGAYVSIDASPTGRIVRASEAAGDLLSLWFSDDWARTTWTETTTTISGFTPCVRYDHQSSSARIWLSYQDATGAIALRHTDDEGATFSMPTTISGAGSRPAFAISPTGLQFHVWRTSGGAISGRWMSAQGSEIKAAYTVVSSGVDDDAVAICWDASSGRWHLAYVAGGSIITVTSADGITFA